MNTTDLIKAAQSREYIKFEDMAKDLLKTKLDSNENMKNFSNRIDTARGITEEETSKEETSKEETSKEETSKEETE